MDKVIQVASKPYCLAMFRVDATETRIRPELVLSDEATEKKHQSSEILVCYMEGIYLVNYHLIF